MLRNYIGDRAFYRRVISVALPIIIQNGIANFVSLLDNIMVGQVGQIPMSGVAIVNQLMFVFNLCVFGATSGAGIFTAQFHGSGDEKGVRHTFRFKVIIGVLICAIGVGLFLLAGQPLIRFDIDKIKAAGYSDTVAVLLTNSDDMEGLELGAK